MPCGAVIVIYYCYFRQFPFVVNFVGLHRTAEKAWGTHVNWVRTEYEDCNFVIDFFTRRDGLLVGKSGRKIRGYKVGGKVF